MPLAEPLGVTVAAPSAPSREGLVLAIDPSSSKSGYAVLTSARQLIDGGVLRGDAADPPLRRALAMGQDVCELVIEHKPATVLIEIPAPRPNWGHEASANLSAYIMAVGVIWCALVSQHPGVSVVTIDVSTWTRGTKKQTRALHLSRQYPAIVSERDRGLDMADAVGLACWWLDRRGVLPARVVKSNTGKKRAAKREVSLFQGAST